MHARKVSTLTNIFCVSLALKASFSWWEHQLYHGIPAVPGHAIGVALLSDLGWSFNKLLLLFCTTGHRVIVSAGAVTSCMGDNIKLQLLLFTRTFESQEAWYNPHVSHIFNLSAVVGSF